MMHFYRGKTVLVNHVLGQLEPDAGRVLVARHDLPGAPLADLASQLGAGAAEEFQADLVAADVADQLLGQRTGPCDIRRIESDENPLVPYEPLVEQLKGHVFLCKSWHEMEL